MLRFWRLRLLWAVIVALAAFVIFIELIVDVGGDDEPVTYQRPTVSASPPAVDEP